jgi:RNase P protein component
MAKLVAVRLQRDIDELLASRKPLAIAGRKSRAVSAYYHLRPASEASEPLLFLIHAPKRAMAKSHDRNLQKRRMREAIRTLPVYSEISEDLRSASKQALVLLRAMRGSSPESAWDVIVADMELIGSQLRKAVLGNA